MKRILFFLILMVSFAGMVNADSSIVVYYNFTIAESSYINTINGTGFINRTGFTGAEGMTIIPFFDQRLKSMVIENTSTLTRVRLFNSSKESVCTSTNITSDGVTKTVYFNQSCSDITGGKNWTITMDNYGNAWDDRYKDAGAYYPHQGLSLNFTCGVDQTGGGWVDYCTSTSYIFNVISLSSEIVGETIYISSNYTTVYENDSIFFNVTTPLSPSSYTINWFLDGVLQAITSSWQWVLSFFDANINNPHTIKLNVTQIVSNNSGGYNWAINVQNISYFISEKNNISVNHEISVLYCSFNLDNLSNITIKFKLVSDSGYTNLSTVFNATGGFYYANFSARNQDFVGQVNLRCEGTKNDTIYMQETYINVYYDIISPYSPYILNPSFGEFDTAIHLVCDGAYDVNNLPLYYDFRANYKNWNGTAMVNNLINVNSSNNAFNWYILNLPNQESVSFSCRSFNGFKYSDWSDSLSNLTIKHGTNLILFDATRMKNHYPYTNVLLNIYCSVDGMSNSKIMGTWADCNSDSQWDYYFDYANLTTTNKTIKRTADYIKCIYSFPSNFFVTIGCVIDKIDKDLPWDDEICRNNEENNNLCQFKRTYPLLISEVIKK